MKKELYKKGDKVQYIGRKWFDSKFKEDYEFYNNVFTVVGTYKSGVYGTEVLVVESEYNQVRDLSQLKLTDKKFWKLDMDDFKRVAPAVMDESEINKLFEI